MKFQVVLSIATSCLEVLFFGGIIFGFPSLQYVLEQEGYFKYLCNNSAEFETKSMTNASGTSSTCREQEASFNLVFTLGISFMSLISFPWGILLDRFGTWVFRTIVTSLFTLGYLFLTFSLPSLSNLLYPIMMLFGMSCRGILMSNYQIANLAKTFRGSIMTLFNGLFSSSIVIFFLVKKGYDLGSDLRTMFLILTFLSFLLWIRTYLIFPKKIIPFPPPSDEIKYGWKEFKCFQNTSRHQDEFSSTSSAVENTFVEKLDRILFTDTLKNLLYWTNIFHYTVIGVRLVFFFSSVLTWLRSFENPEQISSLTDSFAFILLFGLCISPLNGIIIDFIRMFLKSRTPDEKLLNLKASFVSMLITSVLSIIYSALALSLSTYGTFVFHMLTRGFVHGGLAAFIASHFPFYHFGKLFGLNGLIAGIIAFTQYGLFQIVINFDPDFYYVNTGFLIACILTLIHPLAIYIQIRRFQTPPL